MGTENRFNLITKPWIQIAEVGRVSLNQIFSNPTPIVHRALGGNSIQKIALTKLLLAIAQAAYTPKDEDDLKRFGVAGMARECLAYLEKWHDRFWLYGDNHFCRSPLLFL